MIKTTLFMTSAGLFSIASSSGHSSVETAASHTAVSTMTFTATGTPSQYATDTITDTPNRKNP